MTDYSYSKGSSAWNVLFVCAVIGNQVTLIFLSITFGNNFSVYFEIWTLFVAYSEHLLQTIVMISESFASGTSNAIFFSSTSIFKSFRSIFQNLRILSIHFSKNVSWLGITTIAWLQYNSKRNKFSTLRCSIMINFLILTWTLVHIVFHKLVNFWMLYFLPKCGKIKYLLGFDFNVKSKSRVHDCNFTGFLCICESCKRVWLYYLVSPISYVFYW